MDSRLLLGLLGGGRSSVAAPVYDQSRGPSASERTRAPGGAADDVETEFFNFYYTREYQPRIYNDFITLRDKQNYMTKLAISHALAQSVKVRPSSQSINQLQSPS